MFFAADDDRKAQWEDETAASKGVNQGAKITKCGNKRPQTVSKHTSISSSQKGLIGHINCILDTVLIGEPPN